MPYIYRCMSLSSGSIREQGKRDAIVAMRYQQFDLLHVKIEGIKDLMTI